MPDKRLRITATPVNCSIQDVTVIREPNGQYWTLSPNSSLARIIPENHHVFHKIKAPKLVKFNSELSHYSKLDIHRMTLLEIISKNQDILSAFDDMRDKETSSFMPGLTSFLNNTIGALASGSKKIISTVGNVIAKTGKTSENIISSIGHSVSQVLSIFGPISLCISISLIIFLLVKFGRPACLGKEAKGEKNNANEDCRIDFINLPENDKISENIEMINQLEIQGNCNI